MDWLTNVFDWQADQGDRDDAGNMFSIPFGNPVIGKRVDKAAAAKILKAHAGQEWLPAAATEAVLAAYGVPFAASRRVRGAGDAVAAAHKLGFPVVVKAEAEGLLHKSEFRAVRTGLRSGDEVFDAPSELLARLGAKFGTVTL